MNITLEDFTKEEYEEFVVKSIENYSKDLAKSNDITNDKALEMSKKQFEAILEQGIETPGHYFKKVLNSDNTNLGHIWLGPKKGYDKVSFIYDLFIKEEFRGQGLGSLILTYTEVFLKDEGYQKISLHVFGHNKPAIRLYEKNDYQVTNLHMEKAL